MGKMTAAGQQKFDAFVSMVKNRPGEYISSATTAENLGISKSMIHKYWDKIPEILGGSTERCKGLGIQWVPPVVEKATMKNSEGYMDTTAQKAIAKVDREAEAKKKPACGEVWLHTSSGGKVNYIYIVRTFYDHTLSLVLEKGEPPIGDTFYPISLKGSGESYYVDISKIGIKMLKYSTNFIEYLGGDTYIDIRKEVANLFGGADDAYSALGKLKKDLDAEKEAHKSISTSYMEQKKYSMQLKTENDELQKKLDALSESSYKIAEYESQVEFLEDKLRYAESTIKKLKDKKTTTNAGSTLDAIRIKLLEAQLKVYEEEFLKQ